MSITLDRIKGLVSNGDYRISEHGYDRLTSDGLLAKVVIKGLSKAVLVEDYPDYPKGPCVLTLQQDENGQPIHAVWGIPKGKNTPAVLITSYRPDPMKWSADFLKRKS